MCKRGHADHIYVCTRTPCTFVQFSLMHQETALFSRGAATLLRGGLEEGGVHTDWVTDWVQGSHSYRDTLGTHDMHTQWKGMSPLLTFITGTYVLFLLLFCSLWTAELTCQWSSCSPPGCQCWSRVVKGRSGSCLSKGGRGGRWGRSSDPWRSRSIPRGVEECPCQGRRKRLWNYILQYTCIMKQGTPNEPNMAHWMSVWLGEYAGRI